LYALIMHCMITAFLGSFLAYSLMNNEKSRKKIIALRDRQINLLDDAVRQRTEQLNSMRQTIAADFHDQTGNMLAAINRQAAILQLRLNNNPEALPLVESIITNSNGLYASSKDFLWNLNNDSDNPATLFEYLTAYGQNFYNQFDIGFSAKISGTTAQLQQLNPFAALNLIYIFKEAMSNVVKHSGADEVTMQMIYRESDVAYVLKDNGTWKEADIDTAHYGLNNIERRSEKSGFGYRLTKGADGTSIAISLPVNACTI
jgi:signal transduction histidine kinase